MPSRHAKVSKVIPPFESKLTFGKACSREVFADTTNVSFRVGGVPASGVLPQLQAIDVRKDIDGLCVSCSAAHVLSPSTRWINGLVPCLDVV